MTALFPKWFDGAFRLFVTLAVVLIIGTPALLMAWVRTPFHNDQGTPVAQPVQFDHRHHVRDDAIGCLYCHYDAERAPTAGVPDTATCMGCHAQIWTESPELEPIRDSYYKNQPVSWARVHDLPDFVYFNHAVHVTRGVGCETCHGRVDLMAEVYKVENLHMGWCLDCHRNPVPHLRPPNKVTEMGYRPTEPQSSVGERVARELHIDPPTNCSACHR